MTREEIEQKMDELARQYAATHAPEIKKRFAVWLPGDGEVRKAVRNRVQARPLFLALSGHRLSRASNPQPLASRPTR
jgi:hypothetical protein